MEEVKYSAPMGIMDKDGRVLFSPSAELTGTVIDEGREFFALTSDEEDIGEYHFRLLSGWLEERRYALFMRRSDTASLETGAVIADMIEYCARLEGGRRDKETLIKNIIMGNVLPGDVYVRARRYLINNDEMRTAVTVRAEFGEAGTARVIASMQQALSDEKDQFAIALDRRDILMIKRLRYGTSAEIRAFCEEIERLLLSLGIENYAIGAGKCAPKLIELKRSYDESTLAIEANRALFGRGGVALYSELGLGHLIYRLGANARDEFMKNALAKEGFDSLSPELLETAVSFIESDLNISEAARRMYVHRNTLVNRLDQIERATMLDIRRFPDAAVLYAAMMMRGKE